MKLVSKGFRQFFDIAYVNTDNPAEATQKMGQAMVYIADEIHLGKIDIRIETPATIYAPQGIDVTSLCYLSDLGFELDGMVDHAFVTGENGCIRVHLYPVKGYKWDEEEIEAVYFLAQNIFVIMGRARIMGMLSQMARIDTLTGTANVAGLQQFCGMLMSKGTFEEYTYILLNVKNFSSINQKLGPERAIYLFRKYGKALQNMVSCDEMVACSGGDSFVVLVQNDHVNEMLEAIKHISIPPEDGEQPIDIEVYGGIYTVQPGDTLDDVMSGSAMALGRARTSVNQNFVRYSEMMMVQTLKEKEISAVFPQALKEREFTVYYEPVGEIQGETISNCEAMVRWMREGQIVPNLEFIPILEREGSIVDLDFYVLEQVCMDVRRWINDGKSNIHVTVHFSKLHRKGEKLEEHIQFTMAQYEIPEGYVTVD